MDASLLFMIFLLVTAIYVFGYVIVAHMHKQERSELLNRIMANSLSEYKMSEAELQKSTKKPRNYMEEAIRKAYTRDIADDE